MPLFTFARAASIAALLGHAAAENLRGETPTPSAALEAMPGQGNASRSPVPMSESQAMLGNDKTSLSQPQTSGEAAGLPGRSPPWNDYCWEDKGNFCVPVQRSYPPQDPCYESEWECQQSRLDFCWEDKGNFCVRVKRSYPPQYPCYESEWQCWQSKR